MTETLLTAGLPPGPDVAVCLAFAREGWRVVLVGTDCARLEAVVDEVTRRCPGAELLVYRAHVSRDGAVRKLVDTFRAELGLVHCHLDLLGASDTDIDAIVEVASALPDNVRAMIVSASVEPGMGQDGKPGVETWLWKTVRRAVKAVPQSIPVHPFIDDVAHPAEAREKMLVHFLKRAMVLRPPRRRE